MAVIAASAEAVARLSPRQKQCLRLTYQRRVTKEIAAELGLGVGTVNTYCTDAIAILGARNRRDAAEMLHAFEQAGSEAEAAPGRVQLHSGGVPPERAVRPSLPAETAIDWRSLLPLRRKGAPHNDLGLLLRLAWIPLLALAFAIGFGMLAIGLDVISNVFRALRR